jgi:LacI family transcriptional regulator
MALIEKAGPVPRYVQIERILRERIAGGELAPGKRLAGERQLAREFAVSPVTISKALAELAREGLIVRQPGGGTFVCDPSGTGVARQAPGHYTLFLDTTPISHPAANHYMSLLMVGVQEVAAEQGCSIRFIGSARSSGTKRSWMQENAGLLLCGPVADRREEVVALAAAGTPMIVCGTRWSDVQVPTVDSDNRDAARQVVEYLLRLGHTRLAVVSPAPHRTNTIDRLEGCRTTLQDHAIAVREDYFVQAVTPETLGETAWQRLERILLGAEAPTAVFATDYYLALDVLSKVRALGLHVPHDLSLVGFDDPVSAAHLSPPLTTVRQPLPQMGRRAAERLLKIIAGTEDSPEVEVFPTRLVIRDSCRSTRYAEA